MVNLKQENFKNIYLIDKVAEEDKFDHQDFSEILWRIIKDNTLENDLTPFNIGIFGKWGVGKSTVINLFKKSLNKWNLELKGKKEYKFIEFKVWKFSKDALKRKFIFSIGKELLGQEALDQLNTEVRGQKTVSFPLLSKPEFLTEQLRRWRTNISWSLFKSCLYFALMLDIVLIFLNFRFQWGWFKSLTDLLDLLFIPLVGQLPTIFSYFLKSIKEAKISIAFDKYETDEQFEEKFIELVQKNKEAIKIIFIDDLDRCPEDKVIEALETIKTYLDVKTCVFIIACADDVVKRVVEEKRKELCKKGQGADYLDKFFQYTIRIPPFIHENMRDYARKILKFQKNDLQKLEDLDDILSVLIHDEVINPRKAISLINNFASDFEVAIKREESDLSKLNEGDITSRLPVLAVFTVIKTDYPRFYDLLISDNELLKYILWIEEGKENLIEEYHKRILKEIYCTKEPESKIGEIVLDPKLYKDEESKNFVFFIKGVTDIIKDIDNYSYFIYMDADESTYALKGSRVRDLCNYVRQSMVDKAREMLLELKNDEEKKHYFENIIHILTAILKSPREKKLGLKTFFDIIALIPEGDDFRKQICGKAMAAFTEFKRGDTWVEEFNIEGIMFALQYLKSDSTKEETIKIFVDTLSETTKKDLSIKLITAIFHYQQLVERKNTILEISKVLNRREAPPDKKDFIYFTLNEICNFIIKLAGDDKKEAIKKFFSGEAIEELCMTLITLDKPDKDMTEDERQQYGLVERAFNILDETILTKEENIKRRIEIFIKLIPTKNYYFKVIEKLPAIISRIPKDSLPSLLEALANEANLVDGEDLETLLDIIDKITLKTSELPIKTLHPLTVSLPKIICEKYNSGDFGIATKYLVKFCGGRFSEDDQNIILEQLCMKLNIYESTELTQKICKFLLDNDEILTLNARNKFFDTFINGIYDVKTYNKEKFPNEEGIRFWESIAVKVIGLIANKEKLITNISASNCLNAQIDTLSLNQKSILIDIIRIDFKKYTKESQEKLIAVLIPYLSIGVKEKISWGMAQIYSLLKEMNLDELESQLKQTLLINICNAIINIDDNKEKSEALGILLKEERTVTSLGSNYKEIMLSEIELQFDKDRNHTLAFEGFVAEFSGFPAEKQISLCGKYLGSNSYSPENSKKLIKRITEAFSNIKVEVGVLSQPVSNEVEKIDKTTPEEVPNKKIEFIERYLVGINLDERAWTFFAELFASLASYLDITIKKQLGQDTIKTIKIKEELSNVSRNRFSIINILKTANAFNESDVHALFTHLFTSEAREKVELACDFLSLYYKDKKMTRDYRKSYNIAIEEAMKRFEDNQLRDRLMQIKNLL
jgi:hypothetical protein